MSDFPAVAPTLNLDFANSKQLDPRVTFRRASTGTYVDSDGLIKTAGIDVPRFDHNPTTGESLGLLVEESRTNLLLYSQAFVTTWSKSGCTVTDNSAVSPDGSANATTVNTTSTADSVTQGVSITNGITYTFSGYAKASAATEVALIFLSTNGVFPLTQVNFNLSAGTAAVVYGPPLSYSIASVGNGWYRCSVSQTATATATGSVRLATTSPDAVTSYLLWGAQLEVGAFPTSYIPTTASTLTRSADLASMTGTNFSSWYNQSEGTVFTSLAIANDTLSGFSISDGTTANRIALYMNTTNKRLLVVSAGVTQASIFRPYTASITTKSASAYAVNNFQFCEQGTLGTPDNNGSLPISPNRLYIGAYATGSSNYANGTISRLAYWPKRLPDAQLRALTRR